MVISKVTAREKQIIRGLVNRLLKDLEKKLKLTGVSPKKRFRWDQNAIVNEIVEQVGGAVKLIVGRRR